MKKAKPHNTCTVKNQQALGLESTLALFNPRHESNGTELRKRWRLFLNSANGLWLHNKTSGFP